MYSSIILYQKISSQIILYCKARIILGPNAVHEADVSNTSFLLWWKRKKVHADYMLCIFYFFNKNKNKIAKKQKASLQSKHEVIGPTRAQKRGKKMRFSSLYLLEILSSEAFMLGCINIPRWRDCHIFIWFHSASRDISVRGPECIGKVAKPPTSSQIRSRGWSKFWRMDESRSIRVKTNVGWQLCSQLTEVWELRWAFLERKPRLAFKKCILSINFQRYETK